jgi:hypothetical protein
MKIVANPPIGRVCAKNRTVGQIIAMRPCVGGGQVKSGDKDMASASQMLG